MKDAQKIARMIFEGMAEADKDSLFAWMGKQAPKPGPKTKRCRAMKSAAEWWLVKLKSGDVLPGVGWPATMKIDDLVDDYIEVMKRNQISRRGNSTAMGRFLETVDAVEKKRLSLKDGRGRKRHYVFHNLSLCRVAFEMEYGPQDWDGPAALPVEEAQKGVLSPEGAVPV